MIDTVGRTVFPIEGTYCKFSPGERVKIRPQQPTTPGAEILWRVERETWINSLTISNVLTGVPDHVVIVEDPEPDAECRAKRMREIDQLTDGERWMLMFGHPLPANRRNQP